VIPDPDELSQLEHRLTSVRFEPRASLEAELLGRWRRGDEGYPSPPHAWLRRALGLSGVALVLGLGLGGAWRLLLYHAPRIAADHCCQDLDGGGDADDGLLVVSRRGEPLARLAVYEDRDGSHSYTPGDLLRFDRAGEPQVIGPLAAGTRAVEFCCLDYDGDGPPDDALVIVGQPPDRITLAAIYERHGPPGRPTMLR
jgi:hypothetical protein